MPGVRYCACPVGVVKWCVVSVEWLSESDQVDILASSRFYWPSRFCEQSSQYFGIGSVVFDQVDFADERGTNRVDYHYNRADSEQNRVIFFNWVVFADSRVERGANRVDSYHNRADSEQNRVDSGDAHNTFLESTILKQTACYTSPVRGTRKGGPALWVAC